MSVSPSLPPDEIRTFMGDIPQEEYDKRAKLRSYRNAACAMVGQCASDTARNLAWEAIEWVTPNLYASGNAEILDELLLLVSRLLKTAMTAEQFAVIYTAAGGGHGAE